MKPLSVLLAAACLLAACEVPVAGPSAIAPGGGGGVATASVITVVPASTSISGATLPPMATPEPATPLPTLASASLTPTQLKYRILDQYTDFFFCDPDYYPVARADEGVLALERFPELQNNQEEFQAILAHLNLTGLSAFSDEQKLLIYREHKRLAALHFELLDGKYQFQFMTGGEGQSGFNITGMIDGSGRITVQQKTPGFATCPICLAAHTRIDTPDGPVFVEDIRAGDQVWTVGEAGERVAEPVLKVRSVPVSAGHILLHVVLDDGRELWASPGHPTASGEPLASLQAGEMLDGARIRSIEQVSYDGPATYDLLPAGPSGLYWADGILMGSTMGK